jgi:hypothetical protein
MPDLRPYNVFISHAWSHSGEYYRLENLLNEAPLFEWKNYSVPQHDGFGNMSNEELEAELLGQIKPASVVVILAGMYINDSYWIQKEIDMAKAQGKPIIGIKPRGKERVPQIVTDAADGDIVGWNTQSIVDAIRKKSQYVGTLEKQNTENAKDDNNLWDILKAGAIVGGVIVAAVAIGQYLKSKKNQSPSNPPKNPW